jgi:hypothetical protein
MDLVLLDRVAQGPHDVLLADDVREGARTMAAVERGAGGHGEPVYPRLRETLRGPGKTIVGLCAGALALRLALPGFPNYDTSWALEWGRQVAAGHAPDLAAAGAPTPHPLATLLGAALAPLGAATAADVVVWLGCLSLAGLALVVFRLGEAWWGRAAGAIAAAVLLTQPLVLSFGVRAYVDVPFAALVLGALLIETRRPRAGSPVLALLALAGLLRPEAWLLAALYVAWLRRPVLAAWVVLPPIAWAGLDLLSTGHLLHSLTTTRAATGELGRATGFEGLLTSGPGRLEALMGPLALAGATCGGALAAGRLREDRAARLALGTLGAALAAVALVALGGMPVITRYMLVPAALAALLCGLAASRAARHPALALALVAAATPVAAARLRSVEALHGELAERSAARAELTARACRTWQPVREAQLASALRRARSAPACRD